MSAQKQENRSRVGCEVAYQFFLVLPLPAGSMGPKASAAIRFVRRTGHRAAIGTLAQLGGVVAGTHGTQVVSSQTGGQGGNS